jgi:hypothetical protein
MRTRGEAELFSLPKSPRDPFGDDSPPWYKRRTAGTPKEFGFLAAVAGAVLGPVSAAPLRGQLKWLLAPVIGAVPLSAFELSWRARERRRDEALLPELEARN